MHGSPLGEDETKYVKRQYGWPEDAKFLRPQQRVRTLREGLTSSPRCVRTSAPRLRRREAADDCGDTLRVIAFITDPEVTSHIPITSVSRPTFPIAPRVHHPTTSVWIGASCGCMTVIARPSSAPHTRMVPSTPAVITCALLLSNCPARTVPRCLGTRSPRVRLPSPRCEPCRRCRW